MTAKRKKTAKSPKKKNARQNNSQNNKAKQQPQAPPPGDRPPAGKAGKKSRLPLIIVVIVIVASAAAFFLLTPGKEKISADRMNLLVISLDTTRADRIGTYGYKNAHTPNIDRLANAGVVMENCYTPVPVTLPAHASLFTGKYPIGHKARDNGMYVLRPEETTLAELLKDRQYETYAVISSFVLLSKFGLHQGFQTYDDSLNSHKMYNNYTSEIPATEVYRKYMQWFEKNYHKRFFAWVHLYDPHAPYVAPKRFAEKFGKDYSGRYDAEIAFTDEAVGKIIQSLEKKKLLENTLVVIVGDHGEAFGEHQEYGHGIFCYEEALKVPLVIYNKRLFPKPVRVEGRVNIVDIMPTLLELYRIENSTGIQGKSFISLIHGDAEEKPRGFYFESIHGQNEMNWAPVIGILDGTYKYISLPEPELYDLGKDPLEKENLYFKKNRLAKDLDKKLMKVISKYAGIGGDSKREMTDADRAQLKSLGYVSSVSDKSKIGQDPKKGIILDNKIKKVFRTLGKGKLEEAEAEISQLKENHPDIGLPVFYDMLYQLYDRRKNIDRTIAVLEEALAKYPKIERFYILLAFKVYEKGDEIKAADTCRKLLELNDRFTRAYILLGEIDEKKGKIDDALGFYRKALDVEPQNISLKLKYAEIMLRKREIRTALQVYEELLERREVNANPGLLYKIGVVNFQAGKLEKAESLLAKVLEIQPRGKVYYNYALLLAKLGKLTEATRNMKLALGKYSDDLDPGKIDTGNKALKLWAAQLKR